MARNSDDDAPWLAEGVPDNRRDNRSSTMVPRRRLFGGVAVFVLLLALIAIGLHVVVAGKKSSGSSAGVTRAEDAPLITADAGPYKIAPTNPGGLAVEGTDQTIYAAGTGAETGSTIDPSKAAEEPLDRPGAAAPVGPGAATAGGSATAPPKDLLPQTAVHTDPVKLPEATSAPAPTAATTKLAVKPATKPETRLAGILDSKPMPAAVTAKPKPPVNAVDQTASAKLAGGSVSLQLGAFSSADKAEAAWARVSARHGEIARFDHRVEPLDRGGTTLYRLRVRHVGDHDAATALCTALATTGDACLVAS